MNIGLKLQKFWFKATLPFRKTYTANICGHRTKRVGYLTRDGKPVAFQMPLTKNGRPDHCLACIDKMSIACAWCGDAILIGESITLYSPVQGHQMPARAVPFVENGHTAYVGCLGWNCAESGADMCGRWMPPGKVQRMPSPLELVLASCASGNPSLVVVGDFSRYPESVSLHPIPQPSPNPEDPPPRIH